MIRLFIEESDDGATLIRLSDAQVAELCARLGDVLTADRKAIRVQPTRAETERRIALGMEPMHEYRGVPEALAKTGSPDALAWRAASVGLYGA